MQAIYLFESSDAAEIYKKVHKAHIGERILVRGVSSGKYLYSVHDSGRFDYLCLNVSFDQDSVANCAHTYWKEVKTDDPEIQFYCYGKPWTQSSAIEILFYGGLKIIKEDRDKIKECFQVVYQENPEIYPKLYI